MKRLKFILDVKETLCIEKAETQKFDKRDEVEGKHEGKHEDVLVR